MNEKDLVLGKEYFLGEAKKCKGIYKGDFGKAHYFQIPFNILETFIRDANGYVEFPLRGVFEIEKWSFITPIAMKCTEEQFEGINDRLVDMGYKYRDMEFGRHKYIVSNIARENGVISTLVSSVVGWINRMVFESFNPDLFLALAAMTDKEDGIKGEWWKSGLTGKLIMQSESSFSHPILRKATAQEIIEHFEKKGNDLEKTGYGIFCNLCDAFDEVLVAVEKKEFVLPERWCVYPSEITGKWFDKNHTGSGLSVGYANSNHKYLTWPDIGGSHMFNSIPTGYTKISDAQFKKYVLKETTQFCQKTPSIGSVEYTVNVEFDAEKAAEELFEKIVELSKPWYAPKGKELSESTIKSITENFIEGNNRLKSNYATKNIQKVWNDSIEHVKGSIALPIPSTKQATLFDDRVEITEWKPKEGDTIFGVYVSPNGITYEKYEYFPHMEGLFDTGFIKRTESEAKQLVEKLKQAML